MHRRTLLRATVPIGVGPIIGCLGRDPDTTPGSSPTPSAVTPSGCAGFEPHPVDVSTYTLRGYADGFELTASRGLLPMGDDLVVSLRNTTDEERATGNESLYAIQRATADGWEHVLWAPSEWVWTEEALLHQPGEAFEWRLAFTPDGLSAGPGPYRTCPSLPADVYRFVYWGMTDGRRALAVTVRAGFTTEPQVLESFETYAFDHADVGGPIIEGGVSFDMEPYASRHAVDIIDSDDAARRFDHETIRSIDAGAADFLDATDYTEATLVVFQAFPVSSTPDYRVTRVERITEDVHLRVTNEREGGTADVTVETLLVRLPRDGNRPPRHATVTTTDGITYSTV